MNKLTKLENKSIIEQLKDWAERADKSKAKQEEVEIPPSMNHKTKRRVKVFSTPMTLKEKELWDTFYTRNKDRICLWLMKNDQPFEYQYADVEEVYSYGYEHGKVILYGYHTSEYDGVPCSFLTWLTNCLETTLYNFHHKKDESIDSLDDKATKIVNEESTVDDYLGSKNIYAKENAGVSKSHYIEFAKKINAESEMREILNYIDENL